MNDKLWQQAVISLLILGSSTLALQAQEMVSPKALTSTTIARPALNRRSPARGNGGWMGRLDEAVRLTQEQKESIRGLLADQRSSRDALYAKTNTKIRELLQGDQQAKFDKFLAESKRGSKRS